MTRPDLRLSCACAGGAAIGEDIRGPGIEIGVKAAISMESAKSRTGVDAT